MGVRSSSEESYASGAVYRGGLSGYVFSLTIRAVDPLSELLRASLWTRSLTPAQVARVEAETQERVLPVGVPVCPKGEPVEHWIGLIDGLVKMTTVPPEGETTTFLGVTTAGVVGQGPLRMTNTSKYDN